MNFDFQAALVEGTQKALSDLFGSSGSESEPVATEKPVVREDGQAVVHTGDELLIPLFGSDMAHKLVLVQWQQDLQQRSAFYYALRVDNLTNSEEVPFFIAAELYKNSTSANANHIKNVATLVEGEGYKLKVDDRLRYGQKNAKGQLRFVVMHDTERQPFQHRFIETALASAVANGSVCIAEAFGYGDAAEKVANVARNYVGDYLHIFW